MSKEINMDFDETHDEDSSCNEQTDSEQKSNNNNNRKVEDFLKKISIGNYEMAINNIKLKDPVEILEELYPIKNNDTLSNEEKNKQVQEIIKRYME